MRNVRWWFVFLILLTAVGAHGVDPPGLGLGDNLVRITSLPYPPAPSRPIANVTLLYCLLSMGLSCYRLYISVRKILDRHTLPKTARFFSNLTKNRVDGIISVVVYFLFIPLRGEAASYHISQSSCLCFPTDMSPYRTIQKLTAFFSVPTAVLYAVWILLGPRRCTATQSDTYS